MWCHSLLTISVVCPQARPGQPGAAGMLVPREVVPRIAGAGFLPGAAPGLISMVLALSPTRADWHRWAPLVSMVLMSTCWQVPPLD